LTLFFTIEMNDKTLQRIIDEDPFTVEELNKMTIIDDDSEHLPDFKLVLHREFEFQVHYNKKTKRVLILAYRQRKDGDGYENDWCYYYSYTTIRKKQ